MNNMMVINEEQFETTTKDIAIELLQLFGLPDEEAKWSYATEPYMGVSRGFTRIIRAMYDESKTEDEFARRLQAFGEFLEGLTS
jgi:hypothetical protein